MEFVVLLIGVFFILFSIAFLRLHPFLALILAGFVVGILSPRPLDLSEELDQEQIRLRVLLDEGVIQEAEYEERLQQKERNVRLNTSASAQAVQALETTTQEFGSTAASIGVVIVLAAIIGQCLMTSGGADKIVRTSLRLFGQKRAPVSLLGSGYFLSIPVFFDTVFFLLIPLARALRMRTKQDYVLYVLAISGGAVVSHSLVPPTPGPLIMVENFSQMGLELGTALGLGFLLGIPPACVGLLFARIVNNRIRIPLREAPGSTRESLEKLVNASERELPSFFLAALPVALPVFLIAAHTILDTVNTQSRLQVPALVLDWSAFVGNKNFALLAGTAAGLLLLIRQLKSGLSRLRDHLEPAIMSAGVIILITAAGGAFGKMLSRIGIADALDRTVGTGALSGLVLLLLAWGLSSLMKMAQGSGTVAMITSSAMLASLIGSGESLPFHPVYLYAAVGFGSLFVSWMNDSAFWVICKMSGFSEKETLLTWTSLMAVLGVMGLVQVLLLSLLLPLR